MTSPRFNDELDVKYILVETNYNNRALAKKSNCKTMHNAMCNFDMYVECDKLFRNEEDSNSYKKNGSVYIVPPSDHVRLLYTVHSGYTWIDDNENKSAIYKNCEDDIDSVRTMLEENEIDDSGCFVFELAEKTKVSFSNFLFRFLSDLTKMEFCEFFCIKSLYDVMYYKNSKTIVFNFDTESG